MLHQQRIARGHTVRWIVISQNRTSSRGCKRDRSGKTSSHKTACGLCNTTYTIAQSLICTQHVQTIGLWHSRWCDTKSSSCNTLLFNEFYCRPNSHCSIHNNCCLDWAIFTVTILSTYNLGNGNSLPALDSWQPYKTSWLHVNETYHCHFFPILLYGR